ncbi:MAG: MarR family transcriptional regulator [Candidatus Xenobiia bacterium LiM19]
MSSESHSSLFTGQVHEFIGEMSFLYQELISFKLSMEARLTPEVAQLKEHLEVVFPGEPAKQKENLDLLFKTCMVLTRRESPPTMGEMSAALGITLSAATRLVAWLVDNNYAERLSDPDDRRIVRVNLTDRGCEIFKTLSDFIAHRAGLILNQFTEEERILLILLLRKLANNLKALKRQNE